MTTDDLAVQREAMMQSGGGSVRNIWQNLLTRIALAAIVLSLLPIGRV
jgi:hypothetical protein